MSCSKDDAMVLQEKGEKVRDVEMDHGGLEISIYSHRTNCGCTRGSTLLGFCKPIQQSTLQN